MKLKAIKKGFYNDSLIKAGEVFEFAGKKIPQWAIEVKATKPETKKENKQDNKKADDKKAGSQDDNKENTKPVLNDEQKQQYLEMLLNEAVEKKVLIEGLEEKSIEEQIEILENKIKEENK